MGIYFGTDGYRGRANVTLPLAHALKIGQFLGKYYTTEKKHAKILIGKDTRLSSSMFENALAAGASSTGAHVYLLGVCPTPCVSYLVKQEDFDCGIMVSASHNPYYDNGIKLFNHEGKKMEAEIEEMIEKSFDEEIECVVDEKIGTITHYELGVDHYLDYLTQINPLDLTGMKIAVDLANGSATATAVRCLEKMNATLHVMNSKPDGININTKCGSTHPEQLMKFMAENHYDIGLAFDGDADRLIPVDEDGNLMNGDHMLLILGKYMKEIDDLKDHVVVTTVMANLGLYKAFERNGIQSIKTAVGDKYVFEVMDKEGYKVGGEQSGHIIFKDYMNTGDGLLTALRLLTVMKAKNQSLKQLASDLYIYPQLLVNIRVKDKQAVLNNSEVNELIQKISEELGNDGRILVRPSGTEPLLRVMAEASSHELCEECVYRVVDLVKMKEL